jgi:flavin reductase (DIM6/NTAB) family NADH-FMN oxidoreductase RutF
MREAIMKQQQATPHIVGPIGGHAMTGLATAQPAIPAAEFRNAMRHQTCTVAIVACGSGSQRAGLTATAACALSDDPAMVMVCINRNSRVHDAILRCRNFSLNFLSADQIGLAETFSGRTGVNGESRFATGSWRELVTGSPVLDGALASFDCALQSRHEFATHSVFAGLVCATRFEERRDPLLYERGQYLTLNRDAAGPSAWRSMTC